MHPVGFVLFPVLERPADPFFFVLTLFVWLNPLHPLPPLTSTDRLNDRYTRAPPGIAHLDNPIVRTTDPPTVLADFRIFADRSASPCPSLSIIMDLHFFPRERLVGYGPAARGAACLLFGPTRGWASPVADRRVDRSTALPAARRARWWQETATPPNESLLLGHGTPEYAVTGSPVDPPASKEAPAPCFGLSTWVDPAISSSPPPPPSYVPN